MFADVRGEKREGADVTSFFFSIGFLDHPSFSCPMDFAWFCRTADGTMAFTNTTTRSVLRPFETGDETHRG